MYRLLYKLIICDASVLSSFDIPKKILDIISLSVINYIYRCFSHNVYNSEVYKPQNPAFSNLSGKL